MCRRIGDVPRLNRKMALEQLCSNKHRGWAGIAIVLDPGTLAAQLGPTFAAAECAGPQADIHYSVVSVCRM
jgi:hypothetical protein